MGKNEKVASDRLLQAKTGDLEDTGISAAKSLQQEDSKDQKGEVKHESGVPQWAADMGWEIRISKSKGKHYYYNRTMNVTQWTLPPPPAEAPLVEEIEKARAGMERQAKEAAEARFRMQTAQKEEEEPKKVEEEKRVKAEQERKAKEDAERAE